jgi:hypothetical protein
LRSDQINSKWRITKGRPVLKEVIPNVIQAVEHGFELPFLFDADVQVSVNYMPRHAKKTWCMLYCGGAKAVINDLREISHSTGIVLKEESFKW